MAKVEIEFELFRDLVDASGYVSTFYTMFINHETPENCGDLNAAEYLASEASSIVERGRAVLEAVEQKMHPTPPLALVNHCNPVNGVHAPFCTGHETAGG